MDIDIRDAAIINALPTITSSGENGILTIGCGGGRIENWLHNNNYSVLATDIADKREDEYKDIKFEELDILNPPNIQVPIVICSEVLEHLTDIVKVCSNLIELAQDRLIITIPVAQSYFSSDHVNFWFDVPMEQNGVNFRAVNEFYKLFAPYSVGISRIITKQEDKVLEQREYLIIVDLNQKG